MARTDRFSFAAITSGGCSLPPFFERGHPLLASTGCACNYYFHFGFGPGSERANLISSRSARLRTAWWERLSRVAIATALSPAAANDRSSSSSLADHAGPGALISSP